MTAKARSLKISRRAQHVTVAFTENHRAYSNEDWERCIETLKRDLCHEPASVGMHTTEHIELQQLLPLYLADEQAGADVHSAYPLIWALVQSCAECNEVYQLFAEAAPPPPPLHHSAKDSQKDRMSPAAVHVLG